MLLGIFTTVGIVAAAVIPAVLTILGKYSNLETKIEARNESLENKIDTQNQTIKSELDSIKETTGQKNGKGSLVSMMERLLESQSGQDIRMARSDRRQAAYEEKVIAIESHLTKMSDRVEGISKQVKNITERLNTITGETPIVRTTIELGDPQEIEIIRPENARIDTSDEIS